MQHVLCTDCMRLSTEAQPAHEAARQVQQVVHGAMHELDGLAVRREGPVGRAVGSRPAHSFVCRRPRLRVDLMELRPPTALPPTMDDLDVQLRARAQSAAPEDEHVFNEPAQTTAERARSVSARESCSCRAGAGGPRELRDAVHAARPSWQLGTSSTHLAATSE